MSELTRRRVLAIGGVTAMGAVAGCTGSAEDEDGTDGEEADSGDEDQDLEAETPEDGSDGAASEDGSAGGETALGEITLHNLTDESHTVDVIIEFDGTIEYWPTHDLGPDDQWLTLEQNWPTEPGSFRVIAKLSASDESREVTPAEWNDPACLALRVMVHDDAIEISGDTDAGVCEADGGDD